jgi:hypothetical protein
MTISILWFHFEVDEEARGVTDPGVGCTGWLAISTARSAASRALRGTVERNTAAAETNPIESIAKDFGLLANVRDEPRRERARLVQASSL